MSRAVEDPSELLTAIYTIIYTIVHPVYISANVSHPEMHQTRKCTT
jgi:hypothetical protein